MGNNPLAFSDPTGMCFLGCFWKPIFKSPIFRAAVAIAAVVTLNYELLPELGLPAVTAGSTFSISTAASLGIEGAVAGAITTGTLKGAVIGAVSAEAFFGAGSLAAGLPVGFQTAGQIALDGTVGALSSVASGGNFESGFLAAGFSAGADSVDTGYFGVNVALHAVAGGLGSVLGGGKFANGAVTGAFGYMFNELAHQMSLSEQGADFIKSYEKLQLSEYSLNGQELIGYGHAMADGGPSTISLGQANTYFNLDVETTVNLVNKTMDGTLTQNQFDALVSLAYNLKVSTFINSPIVQDINSGNLLGATNAWLTFKAPLPGLLLRRAGEVNIFNSGTYVDHK